MEDRHTPKSTWTSQTVPCQTNSAKNTTSLLERFILILVWAVAAVLWTSVAQAVTGSPDICSTSTEILSFVPETQINGWGLTDEGKLVTLFLGPDNQWAVTVTYPEQSGQSCFIATGRNWQE